jgi:hypothetical protein
MNKRPILITGSHRSGSTWMGKMIAKSKEVHYISEPFNKMHRPGICNSKFYYWFPYITKGSESKYIKSVKDTLNFKFSFWADLKSIKRKGHLRSLIKNYYGFSIAKIKGQRPLVKDPIAIFSAEWLADKFNSQVIVLIRHPAAFAGSLKRLNWTHPFEDFLKQPSLLKKFSNNDINKIKEYAENPPNIIYQAILLWNLIYSTILEYKEKHKEWLFLRHEDISREPIKYYTEIFEYLNLKFTDEIEKNILEYSNENNSKETPNGKTILKRNSKANIKNWKNRLTTEEIDKVFENTKKIAQKFYEQQDW